MTERSLPSVGIGLPVYNNAKHLSKTLDSILNQTYPNITVYISDDCSNDETGRICRSYAAKDRRVIYLRSETNLGTNRNHAKVLSLASTEYFMFARGHEILSPNHVSECIEVLEENPDVVLAFATTEWIDEGDKVIADKPVGYYDTRGFDVVTRCALVLWGNWEGFYGLSRTELLRSIRGHEEMVGNDVVSLLEKALIGPFAHVKSSVRYRRYHYAGETYKDRMRRYRNQNYRRLKGMDRLFPLARLPYNLVLSVLKSEIPSGDKIKVLLVILFNAPMRYLVSKGKPL